jgi:hypothetical protein
LIGELASFNPDDTVIITATKEYKEGAGEFTTYSVTPVGEGDRDR